MNVVTLVTPIDRLLRIEDSRIELMERLKETPCRLRMVFSTLVERLIKDDVETLAMWREAVTPKHGGDRSNKRSIPTLEKQERGKAYTVSRLKRTAPAPAKAIAAKVREDYEALLDTLAALFGENDHEPEQRAA